MTERVRTDPRISRRRRAVQRNRRRRNVALAAGAAVVVGAAWAAFASPLLTVETIKVDGVKNATVDEIRRAAAIGPDENLLLLSTSEVAARVETVPWIKAARVERRLPDTLRIKVQERRPLVVLDLDGETWLLDGSARVLEQQVGESTLPVLAGLALVDPQPGDVLDDREVRAALTVLDSLPPSLAGSVAGIFAPTSQRITLSLEGGTIVRYGSAHRTRAKNQVLRVLLAEVRAEGSPASYIDVRVPENPAVGPGAAPSPAATVSPTPSSTVSPSPSPTD